VDDSLTDADALINALRSSGHAVRASREETLEHIENRITNQVWDLLLCRDTAIQASPEELVELLHRVGKDIPCIVLASDPENKADLYQSGVHDVIGYDDVKRLQFAVARELRNLAMRRDSRRNRRALRESERRAENLLEGSRDAIAYIHDGVHVHVNKAYLTLFGYEQGEDLDGLPIMDSIATDDHGKFKSAVRRFSEQQATAEPETVKMQCIHADGSKFNAQMEFNYAQIDGQSCVQVTIRDDNTGGLGGIASDSELQHLRDHDSLTDLYNRMRFMDELAKATNIATEGGGDSELLYIMLDDCHTIKEQVGLSACDAIIKSIAELLLQQLADDETLGRYSDQAFTIIVPSDNDDEVDMRAEIYRKAIDEYVSYVGGKNLDIYCSIGISRISEGVDSAIDNADRACLQAQQAGGNRIKRHPVSQTPQEQVDSSAERQERLQQVIESDSFCLYYQPIVSMHGEEHEFYEVLLRVENEDGTIVSAEDIIDDAKKYGVMAKIDTWVTRNALDSLEQHRKEHPQTRFFIKLSEQTLASQAYVSWLSTALEAHQLDGSALVFEISEIVAMENLEETKKMIAQLKEIGCEFGLEHFGSGFDFSRSLSVLDVDYLKINGTFVENMVKDPENQAAVKAIIEMTQRAGKQSIAEFVSDANSLAMLWGLGVDYAQGYYIQQPSAELDYNFSDEEEEPEGEEDEEGDDE